MTKNKKILLGLGMGAVLLAAFLLVFLAGVHLGRRPQNRRFFAGSLTGRFGHGTVGIINSLGNNNFVLADRFGKLITVNIDKDTFFRVGGFSDLKKGDRVIVIGEILNPETVIKAKMVRII